MFDFAYNQEPELTDAEVDQLCFDMWGEWPTLILENPINATEVRTRRNVSRILEMHLPELGELRKRDFVDVRAEAIVRGAPKLRKDEYIYAG